VSILLKFLGLTNVGRERKVSPMKEYAITVTDAYKSFGETQALNGVNLNVEKGKVFGLLGPNGAGKTTLVRILTTLLKPERGNATVGGFNVVENPGDVREIIGLTGQFTAVDENLTGKENLEMVGRLYHMSIQDSFDRAKELLERFSLTEAGDRTLKTYSGGMRRRLDLAGSLVNKPSILFLDEPTTGLDPQSRLELWAMIKELVRDGTTVLLTTQYLEEADYLADTIAVIDHGRVIAQGTPAELKAQVGDDILEINISNPTQEKVSDVTEVMTNLGSAPVAQVGALGRLSVPVKSGTRALVEAIRELDALNIEIDDILLRRPTLDEAFLKLTGHKANLS
jgi:ABC-2 type transport system ATP-binding protein